MSRVMLWDSSQGSADAAALILQGRPPSSEDDMCGALREDQDPPVQPSQLTYSSHHPDSRCVFRSHPLLPGMALVISTKGTLWFSAYRCLHSPAPLKSLKWQEEVKCQRQRSPWGLTQVYTTETGIYQVFPWREGEGTHSREVSWVCGS